MAISRVQVEGETVLAAGDATILASELHRVGHSSVCQPVRDAEGAPVLKLPELIAWADAVLHRSDRYAYDGLMLARRRHLRARGFDVRAAA